MESKNGSYGPLKIADILVNGAVFGTVATGNTIGFFESTIEMSDQLLERTKFFGYIVIIGESNGLKYTKELIIMAVVLA